MRLQAVSAACNCCFPASRSAASSSSVLLAYRSAAVLAEVIQLPGAADLIRMTEGLSYHQLLAGSTLSSYYSVMTTQMISLCRPLTPLQTQDVPQVPHM